MILADVAHSRAGDKGTVVNLSVIVFDQADYLLLDAFLTAERVGAHLGALVVGAGIRYDLPQIGAFNFVFRRRPGQSVTRTLDLDPHGKALSSVLLSMSLPDRGTRAS